MGNGLNLARELYSQLMGNQFSFMGQGEFHLQEIYSAVKHNYSCLCDDSLECCECCTSSKGKNPEWQHRVRTALGYLKNKGNVLKERRDYWIILN